MATCCDITGYDVLAEFATLSGFLCHQAGQIPDEGDVIYYDVGDHNGRPTAINVSDIVFENVSGTSRVAEAGSFICAASAPCRSLTLRNVAIRPARGGDGKFECENAFGSATGVVVPASCF